MRAERGLPENLIRLCVGIEDPRDLLDDLEHSLLASGAIVPSVDDKLLSSEKLAAVFKADPEQWAIERARGFRRTNSEGPDGLAEGVSKGLNLHAESQAAASESKTIPHDIAVSAPGKVILFGEHAVVHGVVREEK